MEIKKHNSTPKRALYGSADENKLYPPSRTNKTSKILEYNHMYLLPLRFELLHDVKGSHCRPEADYQTAASLGQGRIVHPPPGAGTNPKVIKKSQPNHFRTDLYPK